MIYSRFQLPDTINVNPIAHLPQLDLFLSTRNHFSDQKKSEEFLLGQNFTRLMTMQRPLTRADHNGTIQCHVKSTVNHDVYLIKSEFIDIQCKIFD